MTPIPSYCAMPLDTQVGASYVCLTCGTTYRHLIGGWTLAGPIAEHLFAEHGWILRPSCRRTTPPRR